ncbi:MAG TPA: response regulator transcription factor [Kofleriaceae bacterium]
MSNEAIRIVYVEDDERLARLTTQYLTSHQIDVTLVTRGDAAVAEVLRVQPDVVLLDLMLPGVDGIEVCRRLRARTHVPIIMVTARTEEADRVIGLEGGADDYVSKPFQSRELLARIRAMARRGRGDAGPRDEQIQIGDLTIDPQTVSVTLAGKEISVTSSEFALLHALARHPGRVLGREQLLQMVHGTNDEAFDRSIDVLVSRLRQKLEEDVRNPKLLKTIRGAGYLLASGRK